MKKKITIIFCIMFIIFNFIFCSVKQVNAVERTGINPSMLTLGDDINGGSSSILKNLRENTASIVDGGDNPTEKTVNLVNSVNNETKGTVMSWTVRLVTFIVAWANNIPELAVEATDHNLHLDYFTIYDLVIGNYEFFNLNFYNQNAENTDTLSYQIKDKIKTYYYIFLNFSLGISIFVLIYIGIRMAISTVTSDRVRYKKMFTDWLSSIVLLVFMHFIIVGISFLSTEMLSLIRRVAETLKINNIEAEIFGGRGEFGRIMKMDLYMSNPVGFHLLNSFITIAIFVYYQLKFFITYVKRFCEIAFLMVVAPLVTITYSIDKVKDNKAQAFSTWLQEIIIKYSIQILHAVIYCIFIASAGVIATEVPLLGALFLLALDKTEKIFRNVLKVSDDSFQRAKVPFLSRRGKKKK